MKNIYLKVNKYFKLFRVLAMTFVLMFISVFVYGSIDVKYWSDLLSAYNAGVPGDNTINITANIPFGATLGNSSHWSTINIVGVGSPSELYGASTFSGFSLTGENTLNFRGNLSFVFFTRVINMTNLAQANFNKAIVTFNKNTAASDNNNGGAMFADRASQINFSDSIISFNTNSALGYGGVIGADNSSKINFSNSTVDFNENKGGVGGAIYAYRYGQINFNKSLISFNKNSSNNGGAMYANTNSRINFNDSIVIFNRNTANINGGVARISDNGQINFNNSPVTFSLNSAGDSGGAIYIISGGQINFNNSKVWFSNNTATNKGGAIYLEDHSKLYLESGEFTGNKAGGNPNDIYLKGGSIITFSPQKGQRLIMYGGIKSEDNTNYIEKTGAGELILMNGAKMEMGGKIDIKAGSFIVRDNSEIDTNQELNVIGGTLLLRDSGKIGTSAELNITGGLLNLQNNSLIETNSAVNIAGGALSLQNNSKIETSAELNIIGGSLILRNNSKIEISADLNVSGGSLILIDNGKIETNTAVNISGGSLRLESVNSSIDIPELNIENAGALAISINFADTIASSVSATVLNISSNAKLLINNIVAVPTMGERIAFIYTDNTNKPDGFDNNNVYGVYHRYLFEWEGSANNWTGYLEYQWRIIQPAFYANLRTLGARAESISDNNIFISQDNENKKVWVSYSFSGLIYNSNENSQEKFTTQSNGIRVGANIIKGWGAFAGYKGITAKQDEDRADASDIEIGTYKEFQINEISINAMASFGFQSIDVKEGASFDTKSIRFALDANAPVFEFADLFGGFRGGYVMANDIKDNEIEMKSAGYMKLDILAGLKKDYAASSKVSLIGKAFLGLTVVGSEPEFDGKKLVAVETVKVKGADEGSFFVGLNGGVNYSLVPSIDLFAGFNAQFASQSTVYGGYLGINYKFGQK